MIPLKNIIFYKDDTWAHVYIKGCLEEELKL